jgi:death-on-curing protein
LVESAIGRPYVGYYRRISEKAAALVQSMAGNHGFADGNKRTTLLLVHLLLTKSGYELSPRGNSKTINKAVEQMILDVVEHKMRMPDITAWFEARIRSVQRQPKGRTSSR